MNNEQFARTLAQARERVARMPERERAAIREMLAETNAPDACPRPWRCDVAQTCVGDCRHA
jgi:hypothetical protein